MSLRLLLPNQLNFRFKRPESSSRTKKEMQPTLHLFLAAGEGFEPSHTESESAVLPLHKPAISVPCRNNKKYYSRYFRKVKPFLTKFFLPEKKLLREAVSTPRTARKGRDCRGNGTPFRAVLTHSTVLGLRRSSGQINGSQQEELVSGPLLEELFLFSAVGPCFLLWALEEEDLLWLLRLALRISSL